MIENIFNNLPDNFPEELFQTLLVNKQVKIERIVSRGHATPANEWYDQDWDEWVLLIKGEAVLAFDDGVRLTMRCGDYVLLPAHRKHRVEWTVSDQDTIWLAVHLHAG